MVHSHRRALRARLLSLRYLLRIGFSSPRFVWGGQSYGRGDPANPAALANVFLGPDSGFSVDGDLLPLPAFFGPDPRIAFGCDRPQLTLQFAVALEPRSIQPAVCQRLLDRAARLRAVGAV